MRPQAAPCQPVVGAKDLLGTLRNMVQYGSPVRIEQRLKLIYGASTDYGIRQGVPIIDYADSKGRASGPGHCIGFPKLESVATSAGAEIYDKELRWSLIDSPMKKLEDFNHVPSASSVVQGGQL